MHIKAQPIGVFTLQRRSAGGILLEELQFKNLITNRGLDMIGESSYFPSYCRLSTSTATPAVTDTTMGGTSVTTQTTSPIFPGTDSVSSTAPYTATSQRGWRFLAGAATGTWSSIGIQSGATDTNTFCKTRIRDGGGTPTSITILAGEVLDVRYEMRIEIDTADVTGTLSGVPYTMRPYGVTQSGFRTWGQTFIGPQVSIAAVNGAIALNSLTATQPFVNFQYFTGGSGVNSSFSAYVSGTYTRAWSVTFGTTVTHASNTIRGIVISNMPMFGYGWALLLDSPGFTKTNLQTCTITGSVSWGRA